MPAGRPSKYNDLDLKKVEKVASKGWTDVEMADFFEVDLTTWYRWKIKHDKFRQSLSHWKECADARVERSLYEKACGYSHVETKVFYNSAEDKTVTKDVIRHYAPDTTSMIFWLKNRQPLEYRDRQENVVTHNTGEVSEKAKNLINNLTEEK